MFLLFDTGLRSYSGPCCHFRVSMPFFNLLSSCFDAAKNNESINQLSDKSVSNVCLCPQLSGSWINEAGILPCFTMPDQILNQCLGRGQKHIVSSQLQAKLHESPNSGTFLSLRSSTETWAVEWSVGAVAHTHNVQPSSSRCREPGLLWGRGKAYFAFTFTQTHTHFCMDTEC